MTHRPFSQLANLMRWIVVCSALALALPVTAQLRVEVSGVGLTQLPITIAAFRGQELAPQKLSSIVQADLERSGQFRGIDGAGMAMDELSRPDLTAWRQRGADSLVAGSVTRLADGRFDVRFRLWDLTRGQDLGGQSYAVTQADLRYVGSVTVDQDLLDAANLLPGEMVHIVDIDNGARLVTYTIAGERGSGVIGINGAAARLVHEGDLVILIAYGQMEDAEARELEPNIVFVDSENKIIGTGSDPAEALPGTGLVRGDIVDNPLLATV